MSDRQLIVDVGMHEGSDTEFYLAKGFDVLAIEAVPDLVRDVSAKLKRYIEAGRLTIVNVAVAVAPGEAVFHVSAREGWGSLKPGRAGSGHRIETRPITVASDTLGNVLAERAPYYVKIDIEGADLDCLHQAMALPVPPRYVSFECDLTRRKATLDALRSLGRAGYRRFKLVNQAMLEHVTCPYPPREGDFVDAQFTYLMSGPFGEEAPGDWRDLDGIMTRFEAVSRQQSVRAGYTETGRVFGIPLGRFHRQLEAIYTSPLVAAARRRYAQTRGTELGGWFDIHAGL